MSTPSYGAVRSFAVYGFICFVFNAADYITWGLQL